MAAALGARISGGNGSQKAEAAAAIAEDRRPTDLSYQVREGRRQSCQIADRLNPMADRSAQQKTLEAEIRRLPDLDLAELRDRWKALFGNPAPPSLRRKFLARAVAYQMQVEAYGGLSNSAKRRLREIAGAVRRGIPDAAGLARQIRPGTQMIRQWRDETHIVTAISHGFEWNGQSYKSLSAVAKEITGTNWNGYAFFGIKRAPTANKNAAGPHRMSGKERASPDVRPASVTVKANRSRSRG
jgi:Protein of unknown function (DUF2924)